MFSVAQEYNPKHSRLKEIILKESNFDETKELLLSIHSIVHTSDVYGLKSKTYADQIWSGLDDETFKTMPTIKDVTFAWNIWHITRIEDLVANVLIINDNQVLDKECMKRLNTKVKDTANSMSDSEIIEFSESVSLKELYNYRKAVGAKTKQIIESIKFSDMKRKIEKSQLTRIFDEGGVIENKESIWLLDFWGKKNIAGLFLMPITRHQVVHLNDCNKLKEKCKRMQNKI